MPAFEVGGYNALHTKSTTLHSFWCEECPYFTYGTYSQLDYKPAKWEENTAYVQNDALLAAVLQFNFQKYWGVIKIFLPEKWTKNVLQCFYYKLQLHV